MGSTGSVGRQSLEVIREHPGIFRVEVLTAWRNAGLLISQAREFAPNSVVIADKDLYGEVRDGLASLPIKVFAGEESLVQIVESDTIDLVIAGIVGFAGLEPLIGAIKRGKRIALANKEALVVAGEQVTTLAVEHGSLILPVDSEHSAIFQCLKGERMSTVDRICLTASGGPFRGWNRKELAGVTAREALTHPNWNMGRKITVDSATMMNKGLEVIEARWLFGIPASAIEVLVHPQSIIHSMVRFTDGSVKAQLGNPDMRLPIQYALSYPERLPVAFSPLDFSEIPDLTFETPDLGNFRNLALAYQALEGGGNLPCVLNAGNEVAVGAFLSGRIGFAEIADVNDYCLMHADFVKYPGLDDLKLTDSETRVLANQWIQNNPS